MDGQRFDNLTRKLASGTSRRAVLKGIAGGIAGSFAGLAAGRPAARACTPDRYTCRNNEDCCSGNCEGYVCQEGDPTSTGTNCTPDRYTCRDDDDCCSGVCTGFVCQPEGTTTGCDADLRTDPANCGSCGNACGPNEICANTVCRDCGPYMAPCNGYCYGACPEGLVFDSACQCSCPPGTIGCDGGCIPDDTCCTAENCQPPRAGTCEGARTCTDGVCGFAPAEQNTLCRAAAGECDAPEFCDGSALTCPDNAFQPPDTACGAAAICTDGTFTPGGACDGAGACVPGAPVSCAPYRCNAAGTACATSCGGNDDCTTDICCGGVCCDTADQTCSASGCALSDETTVTFDQPGTSTFQVDEPMCARFEVAGDSGGAGPTGSAGRGGRISATLSLPVGMYQITVGQRGADGQSDADGGAGGAGGSGAGFGGRGGDGQGFIGGGGGGGGGLNGGDGESASGINGGSGGTQSGPGQSGNVVGAEDGSGPNGGDGVQLGGGGGGGYFGGGGAGLRGGGGGSGFILSANLVAGGFVAPDNTGNGYVTITYPVVCPS